MPDLLSNNPEERRAAVEALLALHAVNQDAVPELPPEPQMPPPRAHNWRMRWDNDPPADVIAALAWDSRTISIDELRTSMRAEIKRALTEVLPRGAKNKLTIIQIQAGAGKTYAAIDVVQELARDGKRVLWCSARHDMFPDMMMHRNFNPSLWYHWQPMRALVPGTDETYCRYCDAQAAWQERGYSAHDMCWQLCSAGEYSTKVCPFRLQKKVADASPIVFAMHNHITVGLASGGFDACVIDETFIDKLIGRRWVPARFLDTGGALDIGVLVTTLARVAASLPDGEALKAKPLLDIIGPILTGVYEQIDAEYKSPKPPRLNTPDDAEKAPYYYLYDLLKAIDKEYHAWRNGWEAWQPVVALTNKGLTIMQRAGVWNNLPKRCVILDATANPDLYRMALPEFDVPPAVRWNVKRKARIYQIVNQLLGKGQVDKNLGDIQQVIAAIRAIIAEHGYVRIGIITHKSAVKAFIEAGFKEHELMHYGALRGMNNFASVEVLFLVGTPAPPGQDVKMAAVVLSGNIEPLEFFDAQDGTYKLSHHHARDVYYNVTEECYHAHEQAVPVRPLAGYWQHPHLQVILDQYRESEIVQAIARARPLTNPCDVFVFSSVAVPVDLDDVYANPGEALHAPSGIHWRHWVRLLPWLSRMRENGEAFGYDEIGRALVADDIETSKRIELRERIVKNARNKKWLDIIRERFGGEIVTIRLPNDGARGPAPKRLKL